MNKAHALLTTTAAALAMVGCAASDSPPNPLEGYEQVNPSTAQAPPEAVTSDYPADRVEHGQYMVSMLGCGNCHTDGALVGKPDTSRLLAGSGTGIARSDPMTNHHPGVLYPSNITPDRETGIGSWSLEKIETMLRSGVNAHGQRTIPVMPWPLYAQLNPEDATAIAMYLKSLPPVEHRVPGNVNPGQRAKAPFVHFGVYRSSE